MQVIFGVMIFEEEPRRTTVQSITGILTVGEDEVNEVIDALDGYDYLIPVLYDGEIIYECPKLVKVNE